MRGRFDAALAPLLLLQTIVLWGSSFRAMAVGSQHTHPLMVSAVRMAPATIALVLLLPLLGSRLPRDRRTWLLAGVTGLLTVTVTIGAIPIATKLAGSANAAVLGSSTPLWVLLIGRVMLRERMSPLALGGIAAGFGGVVLMVSSQLGGSAGAGALIGGMALAALSAAAVGIGLLFVKAQLTSNPGIDLIGLSAAQHVVGGPTLLVIGFAIYGTGGTEWSSGALWGSIAWLAFGASAIGYACFYTAMRRMPAAKASAWMFLAPVVAILVEVGRGNPPGTVELVGMVVTIAGVAVANLAPAPALAAAVTP